MALAVLCPSRHRPHLLQPLVENLRDTAPDAALYFAVCDDESLRALNDAGVTVWMTPEGWSMVQRLQFLYDNTTEPYVYGAQDDSSFPRGWWQPALARAVETDGVVVLGDSHNPNGTTALVSRRYIDTIGGAWGQPGRVLHDGYVHNYAETELFDVAAAHGRLTFLPDIVVEHRHHSYGLAANDDTYTMATAALEADRALYEQRRARWA